MQMMQIDPKQGKTSKGLLTKEFPPITETHYQLTLAVSRMTTGYIMGGDLLLLASPS
jgi:hypothetical protein